MKASIQLIIIIMTRNLYTQACSLIIKSGNGSVCSTQKLIILPTHAQIRKVTFSL